MWIRLENMAQKEKTMELVQPCVKMFDKIKMSPLRTPLPGSIINIQSFKQAAAGIINIQSFKLAATGIISI